MPNRILTRFSFLSIFRASFTIWCLNYFETILGADFSISTLFFYSLIIKRVRYQDLKLERSIETNEEFKFVSSLFVCQHK